MNFKPLSDRVLVESSSAEEKTAGGIIIPDSAKEKPSKGTVVATGPGKYVDNVLEPMNVSIGDVVLYGKFSGKEVNVDGKDYLILKQDDILGKFEN